MKDSNQPAGYLMDAAHLNPRSIATILGAYFFFPGILWVISQRMIKK